MPTWKVVCLGLTSILFTPLPALAQYMPDDSESLELDIEPTEQTSQAITTQDFICPGGKCLQPAPKKEEPKCKNSLRSSKCYRQLYGDSGGGD